MSVLLSNHAHLKEAGSTTGHTHYCMLVVGDMDNRLLCKQRCNDSQLLTSGRLTRRVTVHRAVGGDEVKVHLISLDYVGLDVEEVYSVNYKYGRKPLVRTVYMYVSTCMVKVVCMQVYWEMFSWHFSITVQRNHMRFGGIVAANSGCLCLTLRLYSSFSFGVVSV